MKLTKAERRDKKRRNKRKMKVNGKGVKDLLNIIINKYKK